MRPTSRRWLLASAVAVSCLATGTSATVGQDRLDATFSADGTRQVSFLADGEDHAYDGAVASWRHQY